MIKKEYDCPEFKVVRVLMTDVLSNSGMDPISGEVGGHEGDTGGPDDDNW